MGSFSIWHWLIVLATVVLIFMGRKAKRAVARTDPGGVYVHSATQYISASLHTGRIDAQSTVDRLTDRHKARLPELGINSARILSEAKFALRRRMVISLISLVVPAWLLLIVFETGAQLASELGGDPVAFAMRLLGPLLLMALIGLFEVIAINAYLKRRIVPLNDAPDSDVKQNVSIFGGFSPFAGYGGDQDGWSFAIDTKKASDDHTGPTAPFEQVELLDHVSRQLEKHVVMGDSFDRLFVNGRRIRNQKLLMHDIKAMPNTALSPQIMRARIGKPDHDGRHYRVFSTSFANGHLFLTYFFRSTMVGDKLFVEMSCFLLCPVRAEYTELNELPVRQGLVYYLEQFGHQLMLAPFVWLRGPWFVARESGRLYSKLVHAVFGDPEDKLKVRQETYNYGHARSLRESWTDALYYSYFQKLDKEMIGKTCEYIILNSVIDFLESKGISTEDIKDSRKQIFNSGLIVSGGVVNAHQMAIGQGATAISKISRAISKVSDKAKPKPPNP